MEHLHHLVTHRPLIALHLGAALLALAIGAVVMLRRKGTVDHRVLGWTWVLLMMATAASSVFIRDYRLPNLFGYTPIHAFTLSVAVQVPLALWRVRRGNVGAHAKTMRGLFFGASLVAGLSALLPGRFLGTMLWKHTLGWMA